MNHSNYNRGHWNDHNWKNNNCNNHTNPGGRIVFGIIVALLGVYFLLRALGLLHICMHTLWPIILIALGAMMGARNGFRNNAWWILIVVGAAHLIPRFEVMGTSSNRLIWPLIIIAVGVMMIIRPRRRHRFQQATVGGSVVSSDDKINVDVAFGGRKELVTSKDFKGGTINVMFGGSEVNLTQADFTTPSVTIDCRVSFGAIELVVPANWDVQNEIAPSFGSVEDHRVVHAPVAGEVRKKLILTGSCTCSSIEIKSY